MGMGYGGDTDILAAIYTSLLILICILVRIQVMLCGPSRKFRTVRGIPRSSCMSRVCGNRGSVTVFGAWNEYTEG
jgi:hypothetical protein